MKHVLLKTLCLILTVSVLMGLSMSAFADTAALKTTQQFIGYLEQQGLKYTLVGLENGAETVAVSFILDDLGNTTCKLYFNDSLDSVNLRIWSLVTVSADQNQVLSTINRLNEERGFAKFVYNESNSTIEIHADMFIDEVHCDLCVYNMMMKLFSIANNAEVVQQLRSLE